jgi:hypothetical protein
MTLTRPAARDPASWQGQVTSTKSPAVTLSLDGLLCVPRPRPPQNYLNIAFTAIYAVEAAVKIGALGRKAYFKARGLGFRVERFGRNAYFKARAAHRQYRQGAACLVLGQRDLPVYLCLGLLGPPRTHPPSPVMPLMLHTALMPHDAARPSCSRSGPKARSRNLTPQRGTKHPPQATFFPAHQRCAPARPARRRR